MLEAVLMRPKTVVQEVKRIPVDLLLFKNLRIIYLVSCRWNDVEMSKARSGGIFPQE